MPKWWSLSPHYCLSQEDFDTLVELSKFKEMKTDVVWIYTIDMTKSDLVNSLVTIARLDRSLRITLNYVRRFLLKVKLWEALRLDYLTLLLRQLTGPLKTMPKEMGNEIAILMHTEFKYEHNIIHQIGDEMKTDVPRFTIR